jgi:hypothetical protein
LIRIKFACGDCGFNILSAEEKHMVYVSKNKIEYAQLTMAKYFTSSIGSRVLHGK